MSMYNPWFLTILSVIVLVSIVAYTYIKYSCSPYYKRYRKSWFEVQFIINKGSAFEKDFYNTLVKLGISEENILMNVIIPAKKYETTEIDCVFYHNGSLFVLELKNYLGRIYGKEKQKQWIKYLAGRKYKFMNPLHQNYGHIQNLKALLGDELECVSLIIFNGFCDLKYRISNVLYPSEVVDFINQVHPKTKNILEEIREYEDGNIQHHINNLK